MEKAQVRMNDAGMETVRSTLEHVTISKWISSSPEERCEPLSEMKENLKWCTLVEEFRTACIEYVA